MKLPNEDSKYRTSRERLLKAELALRKQIEEVAALRRKLPPGGEVPEDYVFESESGKVKLSELFKNGNTLVAYSFMYGPKMKQACPSCTSILDSLDGAAPHLAQVTNLVVIARSPIARDYGAETADGAQMPMLNVFRKGRAIRHFWGSELLYAKRDRGQDPRHVDAIWPLWNVLDATPEGRGTDFYPKLSYSK